MFTLMASLALVAKSHEGKPGEHPDRYRRHKRTPEEFEHPAMYQLDRLKREVIAGSKTPAQAAEELITAVSEVFGHVFARLPALAPPPEQPTPENGEPERDLVTGEPVKKEKKK